MVKQNMGAGDGFALIFISAMTLLIIGAIIFSFTPAGKEFTKEAEIRDNCLIDTARSICLEKNMTFEILSSFSTGLRRQFSCIYYSDIHDLGERKYFYLTIEEFKACEPK